jgi:hypothetical protein
VRMVQQHLVEVGGSARKPSGGGVGSQVQHGREV